MRHEVIYRTGRTALMNGVMYAACVGRDPETGQDCRWNTGWYPEDVLKAKGEAHEASDGPPEPRWVSIKEDISEIRYGKDARV